ncbi:hypothetical protein CANARDRAFT_7777 [[Candida] arabinofermentans NRRL YB-2248]|uniref:J domain-containing protein n=1 Tax=[Candida] arabinofermentans NRRL YB-2248 TaxID=983967 RepID=A0A1E4T061_9ASCO|nr:hypothetical protein CANARDRAFT_7777 [[Candida] arabinofermentans NRRL YB-2248]
MTVPFPDINPYDVLDTNVNDSPPAIKKAYYKLCLKYHPDKLTDSEKKLHKDKFERIQFAYSILSDVEKRRYYDSTGKLEKNAGLEDDDFDWSEFFQEMKQTDIQITSDLIEMDKKQYQGSEEERRDISDSMAFYKGDFLKLFEVIPHLEFSKKEEARMFEIVKSMISNGDIQEYRKWKLYIKNRDASIKKTLKQLKDESKEANKALEEINKKYSHKLDGSEDSLKLLIQSKKGNAFDKLLAKYGGEEEFSETPKNSGNKRSLTKKSTKRKEYQLDDDEFERIQQEMLEKSKKKSKR